jgi:hypothetical protein
MNHSIAVASRLCALAMVMATLATSGIAADHALVFHGEQTPPPNDRLHEQSERDIRVTTAVPSAEETREIFGADLYRRNIQPVWIKAENLSDEMLYLTPMGIDKAYFTPRETWARALTLESDARDKVERLENQSIQTLELPGGSVASGYVFTRLDEGTKSFNVDVVGNDEPYLLSFFVPVPGLRLDHYEINVQSHYTEEEIREVTLATLIDELNEMPCCVRDKNGENQGDPLNIVFIGHVKDLYYGFMRAGWDETETIYAGSLAKTAKSAVVGGSYRYSPVSALYVFGRPQDAAMQRARSSINERNHLRIWITPLRLEGVPVWIGQISRDIGVHFTSKTITTHKIDPDVDETREFLLEDLAYAQSLTRFGYVGGVGAASYDDPRGNLTGDPYFTDGRRLVMWIADQPTAIDEIEVLDLGESD